MSSFVRTWSYSKELDNTNLRDFQAKPAANISYAPCNLNSLKAVFMDCENDDDILSSLSCREAGAGECCIVLFTTSVLHYMKQARFFQSAAIFLFSLPFWGC
jgi:hypothetical protein